MCLALPVRVVEVGTDAKDGWATVDMGGTPGAYREGKLANMRRNFYGFDPSYHLARHHFAAPWGPR